MTDLIDPELQKYIEAGNGFLEVKLKALIEDEVKKGQAETAKAYGGCTKCYGKGYATVRDGIIGYEDFGGDGFKSPITTKMKFCTCGRGKGLSELVDREKEQAVMNFVAQYKAERINHTLSTKTNEWKRELDHLGEFHTRFQKSIKAKLGLDK